MKWRAMIETFLTVEASSEEEAQAAAKAALIERLKHAAGTVPRVEKIGT